MQPFMRTLAFLILPFCAMGTLFGAESDAQKRQRIELQKRHDTGNIYADVYSARKSGNWDSDIWWLRRPLEDDAPKGPLKGKRPGARDNCDIYINKGGTVTLSSPASVYRVRVLADKNKLVIAKGGNLSTDSFFGYRGKTTGFMELQDGGELNINELFFISGTERADTGTGEFLQSGGVVNSAKPLFLTAPWIASSSARATGIYTLAGGVLNIAAQAPREGISYGLGTGSFYFGKGTLNTTALAIDLENTHGGNFSPGGDDQIGTTRLMPDRTGAQLTKDKGVTYDAARTYTQAKSSSFTVNIASAKEYDRLIWKTPGGNAKVILKDGAAFKIVCLKKYRPSSAGKFDIIEADQLIIEGKLSLEGPDASGFSYEVIDGEILRLKYGR